MRSRNIFLRNLLAPLQQPFASLQPLGLLVAVCLSAVAEGQIQSGQQTQRQLTQEQASREPSILSSRSSTAQPESSQQVGLPTPPGKAAWSRFNQRREPQRRELLTLSPPPPNLNTEMWPMIIAHSLC